MNAKEFWIQCVLTKYQHEFSGKNEDAKKTKTVLSEYWDVAGVLLKDQTDPKYLSKKTSYSSECVCYAEREDSPKYPDSPDFVIAATYFSSTDTAQAYPARKGKDFD